MRKSSPASTPRPISDNFWSAIEPLLPAPSRGEGQTFVRRPGAGRKPIPARHAFEAVIHVLRTGIPWKALPGDFGSPSAIHRRFDQWHAAGLFQRIWQNGLAEHAELEGIAWEWHLDEATQQNGTSFPLGTPTTLGTGEILRRLWQPSFIRRRRRRDRAS